MLPIFLPSIHIEVSSLAKLYIEVRSVSQGAYMKIRHNMIVFIMLPGTNKSSVNGIVMFSFFLLIFIPLYHHVHTVKGRKCKADNVG